MAKVKRDKNERVLSIRDLSISFKTNFGVVKAIRGVRLDLFQGETIAIVGESGSGKSVTVKTMMGILDSNGVIDSGSIVYTCKEKDGTIQQIDKPQNVYDSPVNLFVAKFLGTPPINVFEGEVKGGRLFIGDQDVLEMKNVDDRKVWVGVRPEGFILDENGPLVCDLSAVEIMGRDTSVVSTHPAFTGVQIRSIIDTAENKVNQDAEKVRFSLKPYKVHIFDHETEERILVEG